MKKRIYIKGMTCTACEAAIERGLKKIQGIQNIKSSYLDGYVDYETIGTEEPLEEIRGAIQKAGYEAEERSENRSAEKKSDGNFTGTQFVGISIILVAAYVIINNLGGFSNIPEISPAMGYMALFVVGLVTSLHCVAMCGGINISQCMGTRENSSTLEKVRPSILYNLGRVISYTIIGGFVGALGSAITLPGYGKGLIAILSGIFMVFMGLNLFGNFPWVRKLIPRLPGSFGVKKGALSANRGPFIVGLLNGLMPCGPLQAMQLYALGTGSFFAGAASMFFFSVGTVPLMFGLGVFSTMVSGKFNKRMMQVGAALVMALGIVMLSRGLAISGLMPGGTPFTSAKASTAATTENVAVLENGVQVIETKLQSNKYPVITVTKGIPVRWNLKADAADITGCNETLIIPGYSIEKKLVPGDNIIEFTPDESGIIPYSCWMGMIRSKINVTESADRTAQSISSENSATTTSPAAANNSATGESCCGGASAALQEYKAEKAHLENGIQTITVKVGNGGYEPAILILEKGVKTKIKFQVDNINSCNGQVYFSENKLDLDFTKGEFETPIFQPGEDIPFQCGMGMLQGYMKVVPDLEKADPEAIRSELLGK